jgi:hypothetical protein
MRPTIPTRLFPLPLLEKLAKDEDEEVCTAVANNTNTPASVLEKIDNTVESRRKSAKNSTQPTLTLPAHNNAAHHT